LSIRFIPDGSTNQSGNAAGAGGGFGGGADAGGPVAGFDPVLISLIRRSMPNLVAYDLAGVQPMSGPTGLIFAMRSRYTNQSGTEAFFNEADTAFSGQDAGFNETAGFTDAVAGMGTTISVRNQPSVLNPVATATSTAYNVGQGMVTGDAEILMVLVLMHSTRWHSQSRKSPLLQSQEH
jgi:hypothetical protein